jgi:flagellum-specific ATP synthase
MGLDFFDKVNLKNIDPGILTGKVTSCEGLIIKATIPDVSMGDLLIVCDKNGNEKLQTEVVGFKADEVFLSPLGSLNGIGPDCLVKTTDSSFSIKISNNILGRVVDGLGKPIDNKSNLNSSFEKPIIESPPHPLDRKRIRSPLITGIRVLDGLLTIGLGQRIGLFAGSGVGKSTLMGTLARRSKADINVVCLVGERGREVKEFLEDSLGEEGMKKSVVVVSTSDAPALRRAYAPQTATAIAEYFRDQGKNVLLMVDSLTRFARAKREIGLSMGEPPARRGYPPSVFASLAPLLERAGTGKTGSITAIYTVLVEGGDMEEPIADEVRGIVDGHIVLKRDLASMGHYPAISVSESVSRVMPNITEKNHMETAKKIKSHISVMENNRDIIRVGVYEKGSDSMIDDAIQKNPQIKSFLIQDDQFTSYEETLNLMNEIVK